MKLLYLVESGKSKFLVFDEMPDKISTKYGDDTIIGRIGGIFYDFLAKRNGRREAFGGRKFDIILDNGKVEKCEGQWWDAVTDRAKEELEKEGDYFPFSFTDIVGYEYKLLYHDKFFEHLHMKRLVIDENIPFPVSTWERSYKYKGYGYNMCRETKKKLLQALKGVNVEEEDVSLYADGGWD